MNVTEQGWLLVPDFSVQLQSAMDYAGLDAKQVSDRLAAVGVESRPQNILRLLKGGDLDKTSSVPGARRRPNPTFVLIAGLAQVCHVPVAWFFDGSSELHDMVERYGERTSADGDED